MGATQRYHHIDWLRVLGMLVVFVYHAARIYDPLFWFGTFEVRNNQTSLVFTLFCFAVTFWLMPLFFLLAGASTSFTLSRKTTSRFLAERAKRLLVPLLFFLVVLIPPQLYMESVQAGKYNGSFLAFLPTAFAGIGLDPSTPHLMTFPQKHLWFLWYLFFMSVLTLPVLRLLGTARGQAWIKRLAGLTDRPGMIFAFILPLALVRAVLAPIFPQYQDWADFCYWSLIYVLGFIMYSDARFEAAVVRQRWNALALGLLCYAGFLFLGWRGGFVPLFTHPGHGPGGALFEFFWCACAWAWLVFFIGLAKTRLTFTNRFLDYANEAVLPFYILHKTVILVIAFSMALLPVNLYVKFLFLLLSAFGVTMLVYEYVLRRVPLLRFASGLPPIRRPAPGARSAVAPAGR